jgi:hypothetical protein
MDIESAEVPQPLPSKAAQEKMPGEAKRWFLFLLRRRRTFDQIGALTGERPSTLRAIFAAESGDTKGAVRKSNANEILTELALLEHVALSRIPAPIFRVFNYLEILRRSDASIYQLVEFSKIALDTVKSTELPTSPAALAFVHLMKGDAYLLLTRHSQLLRPQGLLTAEEQQFLDGDHLVDDIQDRRNEVKRSWTFAAAQAEFESASRIFRSMELRTPLNKTCYAVALDRVYIAYGFENEEADLSEVDFEAKVKELMQESYDSHIEAAHEVYPSWRRMWNLAEAMMVLGQEGRARIYALKAAKMHRQLLSKNGNFESSKRLRPLVSWLKSQISGIDL